MPMQHTEISLAIKMKIFPEKKDIIDLFAQNIHCGYTLEPPANLIFVYKSGVQMGILFIDMFS